MSVSNVWLTINRSCNFRCKWCYTLNNLCNGKDMDFELAQKYILLFKNSNIKKIILIGGEPTLHPRFCDFVSFIKQAGMKVSVATNGQLLSNQHFCRSAIAAGLDSINISLKGVSEDMYRVNTGKEGLRRAIVAYENAVASGCQSVSFSYVVTHNDPEEFYMLAEEIKKVDNGNAKIIVQFAIPEFGRPSNPDDTIELGKCVESIKYALEQKDISYIMELSLPLCTINPSTLDELIAEKRASTCCHISKGTGMIIDTNFCVLPCNHFNGYPYSKEPLPLYDGAIDDFFSKPIVQQLQNNASCYPSDSCATCSRWRYCGGGCFARWFTQTPIAVIDSHK